MSYNNYAISLLGQKRWNELVKEFNLCTKKWTRGRSRDFYKKIDKEIKKILNKMKEEEK